MKPVGFSDCPHIFSIVQTMLRKWVLKDCFSLMYSVMYWGVPHYRGSLHVWLGAAPERFDPACDTLLTSWDRAVHAELTHAQIREWPVCLWIPALYAQMHYLEVNKRLLWYNLSAASETWKEVPAEALVLCSSSVLGQEFWIKEACNSTPWLVQQE